VPPRSFWDWKGARFLLRVTGAYLVVPLTAPVFFFFPQVLFGQRLAFIDFAGIIFLYALFGFAAMVVLGIPLLFFYSRRGWTGLFAFIAGGAVCAAATYIAVVRAGIRPDQFALFTAFGVVEGLALRLILFGARGHPGSAGSSAGAP
jgi:hypothetical protein